MCHGTVNHQKDVTNPKLVIVSWWTLLDKGTIVSGYVAMVTVLFQHVDFSFDLLFFLLCDIHHFDGSQLTSLHMTALEQEFRSMLVYRTNKELGSRT